MLGKKFYTVVCQEKIQTPEVLEERNSYPNQITHTSHPHPLQKSNGLPPEGYHTIETLDYCNID